MSSGILIPHRNDGLMVALQELKLQPIPAYVTTIEAISLSPASAQRAHQMLQRADGIVLLSPRAAQLLVTQCPLPEKLPIFAVGSSTQAALTRHKLRNPVHSPERGEGSDALLNEGRDNGMEKLQRPLIIGGCNMRTRLQIYFSERAGEVMELKLYRRLPTHFGGEEQRALATAIQRAEAVAATHTSALRLLAARASLLGYGLETIRLVAASERIAKVGRCFQFRKIETALGAGADKMASALAAGNR